MSTVALAKSLRDAGRMVGAGVLCIAVPHTAVARYGLVPYALLMSGNHLGPGTEPRLTLH
ncbi:Putative membrane protein [Pseudomonas [fluorescens] SBW25]|uniref:Membrane protein n=1 Tax=Pseudomonas fluorescens (strain SBW25) TaxID=216595 RepID=C3KBR1_PSEFS|nr:Putative membrane protein [Pseudomonas fluorescens SBW25]